MGDVLGMATMLFADEVVRPDALDELPDGDEVKTTKRELDIAKQLVESLADDFDPTKYRDTYRDEVLALIERKAAGEQIAVQPAPEERGAGAGPDERAQGEPRRRQGARRATAMAPRKKRAARQAEGAPAAAKAKPKPRERRAKA